MVISNTVNRIYNTGEKTPKQIDREFIVRQSEFNTIMEDIRTSTMEYPEQEYLIIGEKGMGKTMLLTKIKYEIEGDKKLNTWLIPVAFPEELNGASELYDLWLRVAEYLEEATQFTFFKDLSGKIIATNGVEEAAFAILNKHLKDNRKKIILLIDNFGTFLNELDEKEDHRLREILITNPNLRMIAANPETVREVHRYDKAFYEHFIEIKLRGLNRQETKDLMLNLGKIYGRVQEIEDVIKNEPYRIDALRNLTGGNIRNIVMLFNIILSAKNQDPLSDLIQILDDITPLNTGKISQLKKNQKKIIHYVALQWDAVRTADIANALRMKSNEVSAQLNYLTENQWITRKGKGRKKLYQLRDRFFNIWYLMRYDKRSEKNRVKWLVHFYKIMCRPKQLVDIGKDILFKIDSDICPPQIILILATAYLQTDISDKDKIEYHHKVLTYLNKVAPELSTKLPKIEEVIDDKKSINLLKNKNIENDDAIEQVHEIISDFIADSISGNLKHFLKEEKIVESPAEAHHLLGHVYFEKNIPKWEDNFLKSIDLGHKKAPFCLANCYYRRDEYIKAEKYYQMAIKNKINAAYLYAAHSNYYLENYKKAERLFLQSIKRTKDPDAMDLLGHMYSGDNELQNKGKAVKYFKQAILAGKQKSRSCLAWHYYLHEFEREKKYALKLVKQAYKELEKPYMLINLAIIYLWNDLIEDSIETSKGFLYDEEIIEENDEKILHYLVKLLNKDQLNFVYNYFNNNLNLNLKDRFKPLWYATVYLLEGKHSDEFLKMGEELKETVNNLLEEIET